MDPVESLTARRPSPAKNSVLTVALDKDKIRKKKQHVSMPVGMIRDSTERKRSEESLRLQSAALEAAANAIVITDHNGTIQSVNPAFTKLTGYTAQEAVGKTPRILKSGSHGEPFYHNLWQTISSGQVWSGELTNRRKDGSLYTEEMTITPLRNTDGVIARYIAIKQDITGRKRAEAGLKLFRALIDHSSDGIYVMDPATRRFVDVNESGCRALGYTRDELLALTALDVSAEGDRASFDAADTQMGKAGCAMAETLHRRKDGTTYPVEASLSHVTLDREYLVAIVRDITERRRAEETLRVSEQILNAIPARVFWKDKNLVYLGCNAVFARDAGFAGPKDIIGKDDFQMGWRDQAEKYRGDDRQVIESGISKLLIEEPQTTPEGNTITLLSSKIPLRNSKGEISGMIGTYIDITERKRAEEVLRQSEEQFRAMFDLASVGIAQADPRTGQWVRVNRKMCEITGYSADELLQMRVADITHPEDRLSDRESFERVVRGEAPDYRMEKRYIRKDGELAWVNVNMTVLRDAAGQPTRTMAAIEDISERKRAEEELRWKTAFLEAQVNSSIDGILVVDQDRKTSLQNQRFIDSFKIPQYIVDGGSDESRLRWVTDTIKNPEPFRRKILSLYAHQDEISRDELELKDGTILDRYSSPVLGKDGKYYGRIWTFRDMTERKRAEEALGRIKLQLAHAMSLAQLVAWEYDVASGLFTFSDSYYALHGTTAKLENGNQMSAEVFARKFLYPDDAHLVAEAIAKAVATTDPDCHFQQEARILRRDGELRHVLVYLSITKDAAGRTIQIQGANQDVTESKRAQVELENLHQQLVDASRLGGMAEIATNVLHNVGNVLNSVNISTGLIADHVRKSRTSSLARVVVLLQEHSHDLGAFLTADSRGKHVPAHLARLSEHLTAEQVEIATELDSVRANVDHIKQIVAMQQNYARFGGAKEMTNLVQLAEDSLRMKQGALSRHGVAVVREFENVPPMNVEKHKILQILVNLLGNAKHACDESNRADKQLTFRVANGDGTVKLSVIDNGIGIPPENLTRIFNYGFTTRKGGHGFGLHSSALAAKEMGGSLTARSDGPGQGATFTLELPCPIRENPHE